MTSSVFSSLFNLLDSSSINEIAARLGEPGHAVSRGLESTTAALISSLAERSSDPHSMRQIFGLVNEAPSDVNVSNIARAATASGEVSAATSSLLDSGNKVLTLAFGRNDSSILDAIGRAAGLRRSSVISLVSMVASLLLTALGRLVRSDHLTQEQLGGVLVNQSTGIQDLLPAGMQHHTGREAPQVTRADEDTGPLAIKTIPERPSLLAWLWIVPALLLISLLFWLFTGDHLRQFFQATQGTERTRPAAAVFGDLVIQKLPGNVDLKVAQRGVETQLLGFIQDPAKGVDEARWFDFDRITFDPNSAQLRAESREQLNNIAAILIAYPDVHLKIGGYTDNRGGPQSNLKLSQDRADSVVAELINLGIRPDRLEAEGYGDQYPVADNSTEDGQAQNRRISMRVTQK
jgi:OOP family OmpA-OmpF porin